MSDSAMENKVVVKIYGEEYPITGGSDPAYISRIADFLDTRMNDLAKKSSVKSRDKVAILAAMSIASELFEQSSFVDGKKEAHDVRIDDLLTRIDETLIRTA